MTRYTVSMIPPPSISMACDAHCGHRCDTCHQFPFSFLSPHVSIVRHENTNQHHPRAFQSSTFKFSRKASSSYSLKIDANKASTDDTRNHLVRIEAVVIWEPSLPTVVHDCRYRPSILTVIADRLPSRERRDPSGENTFHV